MDYHVCAYERNNQGSMRKQIRTDEYPESNSLFRRSQHISCTNINYNSNDLLLFSTLTLTISIHTSMLLPAISKIFPHSRFFSAWSTESSFVGASDMSHFSLKYVLFSTYLCMYFLVLTLYVSLDTYRCARQQTDARCMKVDKPYPHIMRCHHILAKHFNSVKDPKSIQTRQ